MNKQTQTIVVILVVLALLILVGKVFGAGADALHSFGIGQSREADELDVSKYFSPTYYKSLKSANLLHYSDAKDKAEQINGAIHLGGAYTNDDTIIGVIKTLKNKAQVSQVADLFQKLTGADMVSSWSNGMTDKAKKTIFNYVQSLPRS